MSDSGMVSRLATVAAGSGLSNHQRERNTLAAAREKLPTAGTVADVRIFNGAVEAPCKSQRVRER